MGPIIILDKSTLQSLSFLEIDFLFRYYLLNITPVLVAEIMGDLSKPRTDGQTDKTRVIQLASKLPQVTSGINFHFRDLILNSLMGDEPPMDGRIPIYGGSPVRDANGALGGVIPETPEEKAIQRWRRGSFSAAEEEEGEYWRTSTRQFDYTGIQEAFRPLISTLPSGANLHEIINYVDVLFSEPGQQRNLLCDILEEFPAPAKMASRVFYRWETSDYQSVSDFSPYAYYCMRLTWAFYLSIAKGVISNRPTNMVDLEYCYYLPFTMAFSSTDRFHRTFVPHFLRPDQDFVWGLDLKADLRLTAQEWDNLDEDARASWLSENGNYPPERPDSITLDLWQKHCRPRSEIVRERNSVPNPELLNEILARRAGFQKIEGLPSGALSGRTDLDFLERERAVHPNDPCPCRSGKKFADCHLPEIQGSTNEDTP